MHKKKLLLSIAGASALTVLLSSNVSAKDSIVYDAEYVKTYKQHKTEWDKEDEGLQKRLADLQAKQVRNLTLSISCGMMQLMAVLVTRC
jgi:hypothetical protein